MDKLSLINQTMAKGFPWLKFPKPLETDFQGFVRQRVLNRVLPVGISAAIFVMLFCALDWYLLHPTVAMHTTIIRIGLVLPVIIISTSWLYFKPPKFYLWVYSLSLLISSLSIIYIIWLAHIQGINLPYEGLMIVMMYGFFIMALPFYLALSINILVVIIYAFTEPLFYLDFATYVNHVLFLTTILISAAIGAYVTEHNQRANFLRKRTLDIHHEKTLQSITQKNKYLAAASHDIRQPLQGITLIGEVLKKSHPDSTHIQHLNKGIQTLNSMFTQMLDISKVNLNLIQPKIDSFPLLDLIEQITQGFMTRLEQKNIRLNYNLEDCSIRSDFTMLSRILHNLIENAVNHSQCTEITICNKINNNEIQLTVMDNGHGITPVMQESIFNEFIKGEESQDGLGLGLAIVSQFCQKLAHPLKFSSEAGNTQFSITIPLALNGLEMTKHEDNKEQILLIDDDPDVLASLTDMLNKWGYTVTPVNGIQHAMNIIKKDWYCIISDWNLTDGCGEEILQYAKEHKIPSILISTHAGETITNCAKNNNSFFLQKPISPSRLRAKLINVI